MFLRKRLVLIGLQVSAVTANRENCRWIRTNHVDKANEGCISTAGPLQSPTHLRQSYYDNWEATEPFDCQEPSLFSHNHLRRQGERNMNSSQSMDEASTACE
eukprot:scaffold50391_cov37-Cyclotella_meneghiniana.AAC.4